MLTMVVGGGNSQGSVSTFVTPPEVGYVRLRLRNGTEDRFRLRSSTKGLQRELGISAFSYLVLGRTGPFCIRAITTLSRTGDVIDESGAIPCRNR